MTRKSEIGKLGEDMACQYLLNKSFTLIERNFRRPWGELDIVAKDQKGTLVFVEVKTMRLFNNSEMNPEDNLTSAKLKKLQRTAALYAGYNEKLINDYAGWRIDLLAIAIPADIARKLTSHSNLTELLKYCDIKHFENI